MAQDLYSVLGLRKDASAADIRKAYRTLAKDLHPDRNPGDAAAEERFKRVSAAYEVLKDSTKRQRYDRGELDEQGKERGFSGGRPFGDEMFRQGGFRYSKRPGADDAGSFEDILSAVFGGGFGGAQSGFGGGSQGAPELKLKLAIDFLEAARGAKKRVALPTGETVELSIPPGTQEGQVLRLRGKARDASGRTGDVLVEMQVTPHSRFSRDGLNVLLDLDVPLATAINGGKVTAPTLDGDVNLTVPSGTSSGRQLRLRGRGLADSKTGEKGDQLVRLMLVLPTDADAAASLKRWADESSSQTADS